jgi:hypothetical protein
MAPYSRALAAPLFRRLVAVLLLCVTGAAGARAADSAGPRKYALLVGCTEYPNAAAIPELWGPVNDVPMFVELLAGHGFAEADVQRLVGWPKDPAERPTRANIVAAFEGLIARAATAAKGGDDVQVFILLSGHGTQVPIPDAQTDPLDPRNPEPDGLDEVFLPADVKKWADGGGLGNAILDDEIGQWLDRLRGHGAAVWIIFDCCHAGTMTRGGDVERSRTVRARILGIPDEAMEKAARKAREAADAARKAGGERARSLAGPEPGPLGLAPAKGGKGGVVAFYAAQPFEEAPELPRPKDAPRTPEHYYGLLSYTLTTTLKQQGPRKQPLTYRELGQILVARYQAERGSRPPTPSLEGDLDREVLGLRSWPGRSAVTLERDKDRLGVTAGGLMGLTAGSVLAVHPPAGDERDAEEVLGHVRVVRVTPTRADVAPCAHGKSPAVAADRLPDRARCRLVEQDFGDMRLTVAVASPPGEEAKKQAARLDNLAGALKELPPDVRRLVAVEADPSAAEWVLTLEGAEALLRQGRGGAVNDPRDAPGGGRERVFGRYPADDLKQLVKGLDLDLQKIYTWRNVWRVAGGLGTGGPDAEALGLKLGFFRLSDGGGPEGPLVSGSAVRPGQRFEFRLANEGAQDLWVTLLLLDANFGIRVIPTSVRAGGSLKPQRGTFKGDAVGKEGLIVLAVPVKPGAGQPSFDFLAQAPLQVSDKPRGTADAPATPFGRLMATAVRNAGVRSIELDVPTNPGVLSWSWYLREPPTKGEKP